MDRALDVARDLAAALRRGQATLFTGAGFSSDARDVRGRSIPTGPELADELWSFCFAGEPRDPSSSLGDLFHLALARDRDALTAFLAERLTVCPDSLPAWYETWFALPWRRLYTVNVDDLAVAAAARFRLPRPVRVISAVAPGASCLEAADGHVLEVVHLNGFLADAPDGVTFSTVQYGERLALEDDCYRRLALDLERVPFVFVGTKLEESPFWKQLDARQVGARPRSFLVTSSLPRAREELLAGLDIVRVPCSAETFARSVLQRIDVGGGSRSRAASG